VNVGYTFSEEFSSRLNLNEKLVKTHLGAKGGNIQTGGPIRGKTFAAKIFLSGPVSMEFDKAFEVLKQFPFQTKTRNLTKHHSDTFEFFYFFSVFSLKTESFQCSNVINIMISA
jgi:hypothetical protein